MPRLLLLDVSTGLGNGKEGILESFILAYGPIGIDTRVHTLASEARMIGQTALILTLALHSA
jgi:hypothetical protein